MRRRRSTRTSRCSALTRSALARSSASAPTSTARRTTHSTRPTRRRRRHCPWWRSHRARRRRRTPRIVVRYAHIRRRTARFAALNNCSTRAYLHRISRGVSLRTVFHRPRSALRRHRPVHKTMLTRIRSNRRISIQRDHPRRASSPHNRPRNSRWCSGRYHRGIRERFPRRRFHHFPVLPCARHCLLRNRAARHRKNSPRQIDRLFPLSIQRMHGHHSQQSRLRAYEYPRHRPERNKSVKAAKPKSWRPQPPIPRLEYPASVVIRQPAPRLRTHKCPAKRRIHKPTSARERRPPQPHSVRPPAISISVDRIPRPIRIKVRHSRAVGTRVHVLPPGIRRGSHRLFAPGNPPIEFIALRQPRNLRRLLVPRAHRQRLPLHQQRVLFLPQNVDPPLGHIHHAAIVEIVQPEPRASRGFRGEVAARYAEIILAARIHIERRRSLAQH